MGAIFNYFQNVIFCFVSIIRKKFINSTDRFENYICLDICKDFDELIFWRGGWQSFSSSTDVCQTFSIYASHLWEQITKKRIFVPFTRTNFNCIINIELEIISFPNYLFEQTRSFYSWAHKYFSLFPIFLLTRLVEKLLDIIRKNFPLSVRIVVCWNSFCRVRIIGWNKSRKKLQGPCGDTKRAHNFIIFLSKHRRWN